MLLRELPRDFGKHWPLVTLSFLEEAHMAAMLDRFCITRAAEELGIDQSTLRRRILSPSWFDLAWFADLTPRG